MIWVKLYVDSDFKRLENYCRGLDRTEKAFPNMWADDWPKRPETLLHILSNKTRFHSTGQFYLLLNRDELIGCGGVYDLNNNRSLALAGVRTWVSKPYRNLQLVKNFLLPAHKAWAVENNFKSVGLSFNDYNKAIIRLFTKGQATSSRTPEHLFYHNIQLSSTPVEINNVPQHLIYEDLTLC